MTWSDRKFWLLYNGAERCRLKTAGNKHRGVNTTSWSEPWGVSLYLRAKLLFHDQNGFGFADVISAWLMDAWIPDEG